VKVLEIIWRQIYIRAGISDYSYSHIWFEDTEEMRGKLISERL
jgi:hypothetical protein